MSRNRKEAFQARKAVGNGSPLKNEINAEQNAEQNAIESLFINKKFDELVKMANLGLDQAALGSLDRELTYNEKNIIAVCDDYEIRNTAFYLFFQEKASSFNKKLCQQIWLLTKDSSKLGEASQEVSRQGCWQSLKPEEGESQDNFAAIQNLITNLLSLYPDISSIEDFNQSHPIFFGNYYATNFALSKMPHEQRLKLWRGIIVNLPNSNDDLIYGEVLKAIYNLSNDEEKNQLFSNIEQSLGLGEKAILPAFGVKFNFLLLVVTQCQSVVDILPKLQEIFCDDLSEDSKKTIFDVFLDENNLAIIKKCLELFSQPQVWQKFSLEQQKAIFLKAAENNFGEVVIKIAEFYKDKPVDDYNPIEWQNEDNLTAFFVLVFKADSNLEYIKALLDLGASTELDDGVSAAFSIDDINNSDLKDLIEYYGNCNSFRLLKANQDENVLSKIDKNIKLLEGDKQETEEAKFTIKESFVLAWQKINNYVIQKEDNCLAKDYDPAMNLASLWLGINVGDNGVVNNVDDENCKLTEEEKDALAFVFAGEDAISEGGANQNVAKKFLVAAISLQSVFDHVESLVVRFKHEVEEFKKTQAASVSGSPHQVTAEQLENFGLGRES